MYNILTHPMLDSIKEEFTLLKDVDSLIDILSIKENSNYTVYQGNIDWSIIKNTHTLNWGSLSSNTIIERMHFSALKNYSNLYIQIGYDEKPMKVSCEILILHWEEILFASNEGFPAMSPDGQIYFELLDTAKVIYSNFKI